MSWYRTGTANFTNGSTVVSGTGTSWVEAATAGEAIQAPDGRIYEIAAVVSATQLTIGQPYLGATAANQSYAIAPTQGFLRDLAEQAAALVNTYSGTINTAGQGKFGDGTVSAPGVRFVADEDTGMRRVGSNTLALVSGGADVVQVTSSGVTVPALAYTGTLTGGTGVVNLGSGQFVKDASGNVGVKGLLTLGTQNTDVGKLVFATPDANPNGRPWGFTAQDGAYGNFAIKVASSAGGDPLAGTAVVTMTAVGNLGIGTASPGAKLDVNGIARLSNGTAFTAANSTIRQIEAVAGAANQFTVGAIGFKTGAFSDQGSVTISTAGGGGLTERAVIDPAGNFGLGVTPSAWGNQRVVFQNRTASLASVAGSPSFMELSANRRLNDSTEYYIESDYATVYQQALGAHRWFTAPAGTAGNPISFTQAMTLDSSGNLLVGTTSSGAKVNIADSVFNQPILNAANTNASYASNLLNIECIRATTDGSYNFLAFAHQGVAYRFYVRDSGNVVNTNNSYGALSDLKLKENITDASPKLDKLMQVRIVNYNLKSDPDKTKMLGVVAQELEQISPGLIEETTDRDADGNDLGTTTKSVKYSVFVPMLIKGMQEQQAQIEALTARLAALEATT